MWCCFCVFIIFKYMMQSPEEDTRVKYRWMWPFMKEWDSPKPSDTIQSEAGLERTNWKQALESSFSQKWHWSLIQSASRTRLAICWFHFFRESNWTFHQPELFSCRICVIGHRANSSESSLFQYYTKSGCCVRLIWNKFGTECFNLTTFTTDILKCPFQGWQKLWIILVSPISSMQQSEEAKWE